MSKRYVWASVVSFQRHRPAHAEKALNPWETGIACGKGPDDVQVIIDMHGKPLPHQPWDYRVTPSVGCFLSEVLE